MKTRIHHGISGASKAGAKVVIIDVFRAVPTALAILKKNPREYLMTSSEDNIISSEPSTIRIGKPFMGSDVMYDAPNSPSRVNEMDITGEDIIHRTAGCGGCLDALKMPKMVLLCCFSNAQATSKFMKMHGGSWDIIAAGHQGSSPVEEDNYCATALASEHPELFVEEHIDDLRMIQSANRFTKDCVEYPLTDLDFCLDTRQIPQVIIAKPLDGIWSLEYLQQRT